MAFNKFIDCTNIRFKKFIFIIKITKFNRKLVLNEKLLT